MYHLYILPSDRRRGKNMKWQATNSCRSNSVGYKIRLGLLKRYFTVTSRFKNPFRKFNFVNSLIRLPFHLFHVLRNSCIITSHNTKFVEKRNLKTVWQKFTSRRKNILKCQIAFFMRGGAVVLTGILLC